MGNTTAASKSHADQPLAVTSIRIERERLEAFKQIAAANRRSVSQEMRWLMDRHINEAKEAA
jgi:hypothetical protein